jgi:TRAP-type C4-dicarboxylate transport system substrate-binding protein
MKKLLLCSLLAVAGPGVAYPATAIKLATLVPEGSVWDLELRAMGNDLARQTNNSLSLKIYPGGIAGDEPDVIRKMRIGQLQAGVLTVAGLTAIDPAFTVFQVPMFFDSYPELFATVDALEPLLAQKLEAKGFVLVGWGHAGWVQLFSTKAVRSPSDLKAVKLFVWAGDNRMVEWWKTNGFKPVPLAATDILTGLQTGIVEALPTTPLAALTLQWYRNAGHMLDLGVAPLVGATIMTKKAWDKLTPAEQAAMRALAQRVEERLEVAIPKQDAEAVEQMKARGLVVNSPATNGGREAWKAQADSFGASMKAGMVPPEVWNAAVAARDAFRAAGTSAGSKP